MNIKKLLIFVLLFSVGVNAEEIEKKEWKKFFDSHDLDGCFLLYDLNKDTYSYYNKKRCETGFLPASTFKIPNSLFALESGAIKDENEIIKWDGVERSYPDWNKDQNLASAIKVSCLWFYQELARRIGTERMQNYVNKANYGNKDITENIDTFWLDGNIRITAFEQIDFLRNFYLYKLSFDKKNVDKVKQIIVLEKNEKYTLSGKTGWPGLDKDDYGWWVGYVERDNNVYFIAINLEIKKREDLPLRLGIAKEILNSLELINLTK
ncbi:MAG: class D beta-lactamase [bacterium]